MDDNLKKDHTEDIDDQVEMINNDYGEKGELHDSAVVIEEADRTVMLTEDETIVIDKELQLDVVPVNRPRKVYAGIWGKAEVATVAMALLAILTSILLFVFLVLPEEKKLEENRARRDQLERELATAKNKYGDITDTETQVVKLTDSVNDFETRFLKPPSSGRLELYQKLNGLIAAYGLVNTSGPNYEPLEIADAQSLLKSDESGRGKFQSLFPGDYISVTVEGTYQNLRRFIREVETSGQFMMVTNVEFEPAEANKRDNETANAQTQTPTVTGVKVNENFPNSSVVNPTLPTTTVQTATRPQAPRGRTIGEKVSLRLELAAYYRRPNFVPLVPKDDEEPK